MGRAVALWLSDEHDSALLEFAGVYGRSPEWKNPRWVRPMYSPTVWRVVSQMAAERERRSKKPQIRAD